MCTLIEIVEAVFLHEEFTSLNLERLVGALLANKRRTTTNKAWRTLARLTCLSTNAKEMGKSLISSEVCTGGDLLLVASDENVTDSEFLEWLKCVETGYVRFVPETLRGCLTLSKRFGGDIPSYKLEEIYLSRAFLESTVSYCDWLLSLSDKGCNWSFHAEQIFTKLLADDLVDLLVKELNKCMNSHCRERCLKLAFRCAFWQQNSPACIEYLFSLVSCEFIQTRLHVMRSSTPSCIFLEKMLDRITANEKHPQEEDIKILLEMAQRSLKTFFVTPCEYSQHSSIHSVDDYSDFHYDIMAQHWLSYARSHLRALALSSSKPKPFLTSLHELSISTEMVLAFSNLHIIPRLCEELKKHTLSQKIREYYVEPLLDVGECLSSLDFADVSMHSYIFRVPIPPRVERCQEKNSSVRFPFDVKNRTSVGSICKKMMANLHYSCNMTTGWYLRRLQSYLTTR